VADRRHCKALSSMDAATSVWSSLHKRSLPYRQIAAPLSRCRPEGVTTTGACKTMFYHIQLTAVNAVRVSQRSTCTCECLGSDCKSTAAILLVILICRDARLSPSPCNTILLLPANCGSSQASQTSDMEHGLRVNRKVIASENCLTAVWTARTGLPLFATSVAVR